MIWCFAGRTYQIVGNLMTRLKHQSFDICYFNIEPFPSWIFMLSSPNRINKLSQSYLESKTSKLSTNVVQKSLEIVFWLPFVASWATSGNRKLCFQLFLSTFVDVLTFSIAAYLLWTLLHANNKYEDHPTHTRSLISAVNEIKVCHYIYNV